MDTDKFIKELFSTPQPKPPKSIDINVIQLDEQATDLDTRDVFQFLLTLFIDSIKYLYGNNSTDKININDISIENVNYINGYFRSFGIDILFKVIVNNTIKRSFIVEGDRLDKFVFYLKISENIVFEIKFNYYLQ
jgi:hypothetical protein